VPVSGERGVPCHGVRMCPPHCRTYWQRDVNAASNIRHIFLFALSHNGALPGWQAAKTVQGWTGRPVG
jgi:transposase